MKKTQKRLGNKGFSLVELIVVIAIMAVLIAVIAPTLIGKIEESREKTDLQAIGEIKTQVSNALGKETIYKELVPTEDEYAKYTLADDCTISGKTETNKELSTVLEKITWKSDAATQDGAATYVYVTNKGKVYVERATSTEAPISIEDGTLSAGTKPIEK